MSLLHISVTCNYIQKLVLGDHPYLLRHLMYIPMYLPNGEKAYTRSVYSQVLLTHTFVCRMRNIKCVLHRAKSHVEFQRDKWSLHKPRHQFWF